MAREKELITLAFPVGGIFKRLSFQEQPMQFTVDAQNVIPDDVYSGRQRGGQRPALVKKYAAQLGSGNKVNLATDVAYYNSSSTSVETPTLFASNGTLYIESSGNLSAVANQTPTLASDVQLTAADHKQVLYIAGDNTGDRAICKYVPSTDTLTVHTASSGTLPTKCQLLAVWKDRLVASGDQTNPHLWYMSKAGDPANWDYSGETGDDRPIEGANSRAGVLGEPVRALIPHNDDCIIFGCSSSMWSLRGDPARSGRLHNLTPLVGCLDRGSWCHDPMGRLWFWTHNGLYKMDAPCGDTPIPVSREFLPEELLNVDWQSYTVNMAYDIRYRGIHLFVSDNSSTDSTHYFIDVTLFASTGQVGFWKIVYQNSHDPFSVVTRRDTSSVSGGESKSLTYIGGRDGYVRQWDHTGTTDDGSNAIASHLYLGPIHLGGQEYSEGILEQLVATLDSSSSDVDWDVYVGKSAQAAYEAASRENGTWNMAGVNQTSYPRARGQAAFVKLSNGENNRWAIESVLAVIRGSGRRRV